MDKIIPYGRQDIDQEDINAVVNALKSDFLTQGPAIQDFEEAFAQYVGAKYAVAVANGTAALHLCTLALKVNEGQKVITSPITFAASANCVKYCNGEVVFADIDRNSYLLDINEVTKLLEQAPEKTYAGIIPVDFTGFPVNLEQYRKLADEYGLWIIEDACHAPGGYFIDSAGEEQYCGNGQFADLSIFSFHPAKHIASGEGGMITTNNPELYEKLQLLRTHGITKNPDLLNENHGGWYYEMQSLGFNYRITDFQCALGNSQLKKAQQGLRKRHQIAKKYDDAFKNMGIVKQVRDRNYFNAYHLYVIEVEDRKGLYDYLRKHNILAQVHYIPLHTMPYYQQYNYKKGDFPMAEDYYSRCLSIPMYPALTDEDQEYVIKTIKDYLSE